jgi:hypothetical protein
MTQLGTDVRLLAELVREVDTTIAKGSLPDLGEALAC